MESCRRPIKLLLVSLRGVFEDSCYLAFISIAYQRRWKRADDAVLIYSATIPLELNKILHRDFSLISEWYTNNRLTLNVK